MSRTTRKMYPWSIREKTLIDSGELPPEPRSPWLNGRDGIFSNVHGASSNSPNGYDTFNEIGRGYTKLAKRAASKARRRNINYEE